jgi:hypothetical protein
MMCFWPLCRFFSCIKALGGRRGYAMSWSQCFC